MSDPEDYFRTQRKIGEGLDEYAERVKDEPDAAVLVRYETEMIREKQNRHKMCDPPKIPVVERSLNDKAVDSISASLKLKIAAMIHEGFESWGGLIECYGYEVEVGLTMKARE